MLCSVPDIVSKVVRHREVVNGKAVVFPWWDRRSPRFTLPKDLIGRICQCGLRHCFQRHRPSIKEVGPSTQAFTTTTFWFIEWIPRRTIIVAIRDSRGSVPRFSYEMYGASPAAVSIFTECFTFPSLCIHSAAQNTTRQSAVLLHFPRSPDAKVAECSSRFTARPMTVGYTIPEIRPQQQYLTSSMQFCPSVC